MEPDEYGNIFALEESYWWYRGLRELAARELRRFLAEAPGRNTVPDGAARSRPLRILDAGCGTGGMLLRLEDLGSVHGLDFSPLAVAYAARRRPWPLVRGSVSRLPYREGSFDAVVSLDVLYHRGVADDLEALREFRRCLASGGLVLLNLPAYEALRSSHDEAVHTARRYTRPGLVKLLRAAGLQPLRVTYWNTLLFPALALVRRLRRGGHGSDVGGLPPALNAGLGAVLALERGWLRWADCPFGLSLMAVAARPSSPSSPAARP